MSVKIHSKISTAINNLSMALRQGVSMEKERAMPTTRTPQCCLHVFCRDESHLPMRRTMSIIGREEKKKTGMGI